MPYNILFCLRTHASLRRKYQLHANGNNNNIIISIVFFPMPGSKKSHAVCVHLRRKYILYVCDTSGVYSISLRRSASGERCQNMLYKIFIFSQVLILRTGKKCTLYKMIRPFTNIVIIIYKLVSSEWIDPRDPLFEYVTDIVRTQCRRSLYLSVTDIVVDLAGGKLIGKLFTNKIQ